MELRKRGIQHGGQGAAPRITRRFFNRSTRLRQGYDAAGEETEKRERISKEGREGNRKIEDDDEDEHEDERAQGTLLAVQYFRPE